MSQGKDLTVTDPNMTRYMMSLEESVDLVLHAFANGDQGDIFVQKAPACTVLELATALKELFDSNVGIKVIGARHGEKAYETLLTKEEFVKAEDQGNYFRIPSDNRDLNYAKYFTEGEGSRRNQEEYNSDNTNRINVEQVKEMLLKLPYIQSELKKFRVIDHKEIENLVESM